MLQCSTSLWSADLTRLADDLKRVEPYSEKFHLDVADGQYVPNLLFFPDLIRQLRPLTSKPFEVHLMVTQPEKWIQPFLEAGADIVIFCHDSTPHPLKLLQSIHSHGVRAGLSLQIHESIDLLEPLWKDLDVLCIIGTAMGIKGATMDPAIPDKIVQARRLINQHGYATEIEADGGIRRETVPLLKNAGADTIVPGSLMFKEDPAAMRSWLRAL